MKKTLIALSMILMVVMVVGCGKKASVAGTYVFDTDKFMAGLKDATGGQEMPQEIVDNALKMFADYKVVVTDTEATVSMGELSVKGTLKLMSQADAETKYQMTPLDEDKKNDPVTMVFYKDGSMMIDPEDGSTDQQNKMFFKKQ